MTIDADLRNRVRERAGFACEFCEVTETDTGGELTIDHFHPQAKGGTDDLKNLLYCCPRCNQYKLDYWPAQTGDVPLWNPRGSPRTAHFLQLDDGTLHPLTQTGAFTIKRLRLNRPPLVAYRVRRQDQEQTRRALVRYRELLELQERLQTQVATLLEEQRSLMDEQQALLRLLLNITEEG